MTLFKKGSSEIMRANIPRKLTTHDSVRVDSSKYQGEKDD